MPTGALGIVEAWQPAVNGGSVADAVALTAEQVEILGPRGEGAHAQARARRLDGAVRVHGNTPALVLRRQRDVVVEQDARWVDRETGQERDQAVVASHFKVDDGVLSRIARHDEGLQAALDSAGLSSGDEVLDRA